MSQTIKLALGSIAVTIGVLALKFWAARITGSVALLSDALESVVNLATAIAALIAVRLAARPADAAMPYGYHKAEYFSAVIEGVFIVVAALLIFHQAWQGFAAPQPLSAPLEGIVISVVASAINGVWCLVLIRQGRRLQSPALEADGHHLWTDVVSSVGVVVGLLLVLATDQPLLDPLIAALVGLNILWSGTRLLARSVGGLMDVAVPKEQLDEIRAAIQANAEGAIEAHDLRARQAGKATFIDFHLVVPGAMSVEDAHAICDRIEAALKTISTEALITIHVEPEDKAKHSGIVVL
ncbi:cation diffusion facilitator family transporter [Pelagibacterium sp. 26DY04]|uniref:cation diffusion facilitator family transporter n=1 Tax=Pelagibacterium sp. 26DY04 TaxID=2967130 RepID=UPI002815EAE0|nr:cation diffusion facilitator family transporter [Pelagibacterium sp. 26DY04]WMT87250.1 cation diffusion facilitator family transporter [Pelagibacterium sp. 26DY04]